MNLHDFTYAVNFLALIAAFWLGAYLVTRNPRTPTAWLTAFTLWSLGGLFLIIRKTVRHSSGCFFVPRRR